MSRFLALALALCVLAPASTVHADQNDAKLDVLFARLQQANDHSEAMDIEQAIWTAWIRHDDDEINKLMSVGIEAMNAGSLKLSILAFGDIIRTDPAYAEGWNKRATAYYLMERYEESVLDIQQTLKLEPRHFGALSGLGLIYMAIGKDEAALSVWEKALSINPQMLGIRERVRELRKKFRGEPA